MCVIICRENDCYAMMHSLIHELNSMFSGSFQGFQNGHMDNIWLCKCYHLLILDDIYASFSYCCGYGSVNMYTLIYRFFDDKINRAVQQLAALHGGLRPYGALTNQR